jgi:hypothetical protein
VEEEYLRQQVDILVTDFPVMKGEHLLPPFLKVCMGTMASDYIDP